ncbi:MAG TPA: hypothetical protein ENN87_00650 [Phycisphaerales bacterium]|nr:hypothetical protein [Phycisphaerales bacterium]
MRPLPFVAVLVLIVAAPALGQVDPSDDLLAWTPLPDLPDPLGRAGAFVGVHNEALIFAGGANFPPPVWDNEKTWHADVFVLEKTPDGYVWHEGFTLDRPLAYGACVSTRHGLLCMGGNDSQNTWANVSLLSWDPDRKQLA